MNELKRCPFCGGHVEIADTAHAMPAIIACRKCKVVFFVPWHYATSEADLRLFWNTRESEGSDNADS